MAKKKPPTQTHVGPVPLTPRLRAAAQPKATPSPQHRPRIPAKSVERAKSAFSKFTLSKFAGNEPPPNYVTTKGTVAGVQRHIISKAINTLQSSPPNRAMTLALPSGDIKKLLPSFDSKSGHVQLGDVLGLMEQRRVGAEFYARGNPTLNRLAVEATVQQILNSFKKDAKK